MSKDRKQYMRDYPSRKQEEVRNENRAQQIEKEMRQSFETAKARLEEGLKDLMPGSNAHRQLVKDIADLERDYRRERAERGLDPERLGAAERNGFHFICHVGPKHR